MSQLIAMRQRIKTVETIKKITSAMRLVSRSFHTKLDKQKKPLTEYRDTLCQLLAYVQPFCPTWNDERFFPTASTPPKELFIIIGSQKGFCGTFNSGLLYWIDKNRSTLTSSDSYVISVGKKVTDHCAKRAISADYNFCDVKSTQLGATTQKIFNLVLHGKQKYTKVTVISNRARSFFAHDVHVLGLLPFIGCNAQTPSLSLESFRWEHTPEIVLNRIAEEIVKSSIHTALFDSLHAEQSARFISMDNATRNADNFLDTMKLQYNKVRQAKITKELTELALSK